MTVVLLAFSCLALGAAVFIATTAIFAWNYAPALPASPVHTLAFLIREWVVSIAVVPLLLLGLRPAPAPAPHPTTESRVPVLLLHGYDMNRATMWPLAAYLHARGWKWAHAVNHATWDNPIAAHARQVAEHIQALQVASGAPQVDIVAHSMGGIIAAWYATRMNGAANIRRIVTIGTPWLGTHLARLGWRAESRDMQPGGSVIADIQDLTVPVTCIWTQCDLVVVPARNSVRPQAKVVEIPVAGHLDMLVDGRVFAAVRDALAAPEEAA